MLPAGPLLVVSSLLSRSLFSESLPLYWVLPMRVQLDSAEVVKGRNTIEVPKTSMRVVSWCPLTYKEATNPSFLEPKGSVTTFKWYLGVPLHVCMLSHFSRI